MKLPLVIHYHTNIDILEQWTSECPTRVLCPEFLSVYHMPYEQAEAAVRETENELFARKQFRKWKSYNREFPIDAYTLTQRKDVRIWYEWNWELSCTIFNY